MECVCVADFVVLEELVSDAEGCAVCLELLSDAVSVTSSVPESENEVVVVYVAVTSDVLLVVLDGVSYEADGCSVRCVISIVRDVVNTNVSLSDGVGLSLVVGDGLPLLDLVLE